MREVYITKKKKKQRIENYILYRVLIVHLSF